jgi:hypothetical protein
MNIPLPIVLRSLGTLACLFLTSVTCHAENLLANGNFDHKDGPLTGWITDYAFSGNSHYMNNKNCVSVIDGKAVFKDNGVDGVKLECRPMAIEPGFKYTAKLDVKGGPSRIYIAGYKWKPGVRPHDNPELGELRMIYKSNAIVTESLSAVKRETIELPGVKLSPQAKTALKEVRFISLFIYMLGEASVANVTMTKNPDPEMKL